MTTTSPQGFSVAGDGNTDDGTDDISPEFTRQFANYTTREMAKELYNDAGLEWPDWVDDPNIDVGGSRGDDDSNSSTDSGSSDDTGAGSRVAPDSQAGKADDQEADTSADVHSEGNRQSSGQQGTPASTPASTPATTVTIGGKEIPFQQAQALVEWGEYLRSNPDKAEQVMAVMQGKVIPPAPSQYDRSRSEPEGTGTATVGKQSSIPEGFTSDDPRDKFVLDKISELNSNLQQLHQLTQQQVEQANRSKAENDVNIAISRLKSTHPTFTDDDIRSIRQKTAELQIVPGMVAKHKSDPVTGLVEAMEAGMWNVPGLRDRLYEQATNKSDKTTGSSNGNTSHTPDRTRQSKLSALSGRSGSTPRNEPSPRLDSDREMKDAIAKAVSAYFPGNSN